VLAPERNREHSIEDQVTALNVGFMERLQTNSACRLINQHLLEHPQLLWPMLVRTEGWLCSREQLRAELGGKREGAGRLSKPSVEVGTEVCRVIDQNDLFFFAS
jgi:hypothetical protein